MVRRFLVLGAGALALAVVLTAPGHVQAQRMRGGFANGVHTGFRGAVTPGFRGGFDPRFNPRFFSTLSALNRHTTQC